jgi:hypothetical protein
MGCSVPRLSLRKGMPSPRLLHRWLGRHEDFRLDYAAACEVRTQVLADEVVKIADDFPFSERPGIEWELEALRLRLRARIYMVEAMTPRKHRLRLPSLWG